MEKASVKGASPKAAGQKAIVAVKTVKKSSKEIEAAADASKEEARAAAEAVKVCIQIRLKLMKDIVNV